MTDKVGFKQGSFTTETDILSKLNAGDMFMDTGSNGTGLYLCGSNTDGTKKLYNIAYGKKQYDKVKLDATYECIDVGNIGESEASINATADQIAAFEDPSRKIFIHSYGYGSDISPIAIDMDTNKVIYRQGFDGEYVYTGRIENNNLIIKSIKLSLTVEDGSITKSKLSTDVRTSLDKAEYAGDMVNQCVQINSQDFTASAARAARANIKLPDFITFSSPSELASAPISSTAYAFYVGSGDDIVTSPLIINSGWKMIDFNGMTLHVTDSTLPTTAASIIKGHSHCVIKNLSVSGTWKVDTNVASNVIDTLAGGENIVIDVTFSGSKYGRGFHSCQRLENCKVTLSGSAMVEGHYYNYCEYLNNCRCAKATAGASIGFYNCTSMTNCDVFDGACSKSPMTNCSNYMNVSYYVNGVRKYFSDTNSLTVNGTDTNKFFDECKRDADEADRTGYNRILYIKPGGAFSSWPMANSALNNSICYRDSAGSIKVNDGHNTGVASTVDYVDSSISGIKPVKTVKVNGTTYSPNTAGLVDLGTIGGGSTGAVKLDAENNAGSWTVFKINGATDHADAGIYVLDGNADRYTSITPDVLRVRRSNSSEYRNGGTIIDGGDILMHNDDTANMVKMQFSDEHSSGKCLKVSWMEDNTENPVNISNVADPEESQDVATKNYVDMMIPSDIYKPIYVDRNLIDLDVNSTVTALTWTTIKSAIGKGLIINGNMTPSTELSSTVYTYGINANVNAKYTKIDSTSTRLTSVTVSFMDEDDTYRKITFNASGKITAKTTKNILDSTAVANQLAQI